MFPADLPMERLCANQVPKTLRRVLYTAAETWLVEHVDDGLLRIGHRDPLIADPLESRSKMPVIAH